MPAASPTSAPAASPLAPGTGAAPPRAVVIGGGLAGIAAAVALSQAGCHVTLLEQRRSLGGRAGSYDDPQTGATLDNCQHVLLGCCTNLLDLYRRIGVADRVRFDRTIRFLDPAGRAFALAGFGGLPAPLHLGPSLLRFSLLTLAERLALSRAMLAMMRFDAAARLKLLDVPFGDWLDAHGQPPELVRKLYDPVLISALNEDTRRVSAAYAIQVFQGSLLSNARGYVMGVPQCPLGALYEGLGVMDEGDGGNKGTREGGNEGTSCAGDEEDDEGTGRQRDGRISRRRSGAPDLMQPAVTPNSVGSPARIAHHASRPRNLGLRSAALRSDPGLPGSLTVRPGARVARLVFASRPLPSNPEALPPITSVEFLDGSRLDADAVVLATNHHAARRLVPHDLAARDGRLPPTAALEDVPILGAHLTFDRPVLPAGWPHVALVDGPLQWLFRKDPAGRTLHGVISAARPFLNRPHAELLPRFEQQVRTVLPAARDARLERGTIVIEKRATFSPLPGADRHRPPQAPPPAGIPNLFLAGDYTQTGWPATMEGAVRSGYLAAEAVLCRAGKQEGESWGSFIENDLPAQWPCRLFRRYS